MRIGVLTLDWPPVGGGMSRLCVETVRALAARGHHLTILTGKPGPAPHPNVIVHHGLTGDLSTDGKITRPLENHVDVWHGWEHGFGGLAAELGRPMVVTVHGNDLIRPKVFYRLTRTPLLHRLAPRMRRPAWQERLCRDSFDEVACFLANSRRTAQLLREMYPARAPVEVVPCGVSDAFFQNHRCNGGPTRFLTVCSLSQQRQRKNVDGVLRALALLKDEFAFHYDVCGSGDWFDELRLLAVELGLSDRVSFHGAVCDAHLLELYARADLFVLAPWESADDIEGFGIVYLEANAAQTPVLATRSGGVTDAVKEGVSGYFAESCDPVDLASALRQFLRGEKRFDRPAIQDWAGAHRYDDVARRCEAIYARTRSAATVAV